MPSASHSPPLIQGFVTNSVQKGCFRAALKFSFDTALILHKVRNTLTPLVFQIAAPAVDMTPQRGTIARLPSRTGAFGDGEPYQEAAVDCEAWPIAGPGAPIPPYRFAPPFENGTPLTGQHYTARLFGLGMATFERHEPELAPNDNLMRLDEDQNTEESIELAPKRNFLRRGLISRPKKTPVRGSGLAVFGSQGGGEQASPEQHSRAEWSWQLEP